MDQVEYSVNTRPLLDNSSESDDEGRVTNIEEQDDHVFAGDTKPLFKIHEPTDTYCIAYLVFYLLGMITLLPWNFFITADDYWMYKFRDPSSNLSLQYHSAASRTPLQAGFTSYVSVASAVPNTLILLMTTFINQRISLAKRMYFSLGTIIVIFITTTVLVKVDTDSWQQQFFILTMASIVISNVASAVLSGSILGIIGNFSPRYITAVIGGQALGGIFTSLTQIATLAIGASSVHSGFVYFMIGNCVLVLALFSYAFLSQTHFFNYYMQGKSHHFGNQLQAESSAVFEIDNKEVLRKMWKYGFAEGMVMLVTLAIYPGVTVLVESQGKGKGHVWNDVYFVPVVTYLIFNMGDYTGRILAGVFQKPHDKPNLVMVLSVLRIFFIPFLILCNEQPRHTLPVLITSDYLYIAILVLFAITNGYLANLPVICAPRVVEPYEKETASSMMAAFLGSGLALGSVICFGLVKII